MTAEFYRLGEVHPLARRVFQVRKMRPCDAVKLLLLKFLTETMSLPERFVVIVRNQGVNIVCDVKVFDDARMFIADPVHTVTLDRSEFSWNENKEIPKEA